MDMDVGDGESRSTVYDVDNLPASVSRRLFIFGLGYVGQKAAQYFRDHNFEVAGTVRDEETATRLEQDIGVPTFVFDGGSPGGTLSVCARNYLQYSSHILVCAPPINDKQKRSSSTLERGKTRSDEGGDGERSSQGGPETQHRHVDPVLRAMYTEVCTLHHVGWVGYLSTTGVYGDRDGGEVSEEDETCPLTTRGKLRVEAENDWFSTTLPVHVFRLPGIYGPGRGPLSRVQSGNFRCVDKPGHKFNRIHVDDIVQTVYKSALRPKLYGCIYNVVDDEPTPSHVPYVFSCELLGREPPSLIPYDRASEVLTPMALTFYKENRRVMNRRIKEELGVVLLYPSYREGLRASLDQEKEERSLRSKQEAERKTQTATSSENGREDFASEDKHLVLLTDIGSSVSATIEGLRHLRNLLKWRIEKGIDSIDIAETKSRLKNVRRPAIYVAFGSCLIAAQRTEARESLEDIILHHVQLGVSQISILPLFISKSYSLSTRLANRMKALKQNLPSGVNIRILEPIISNLSGNPSLTRPDGGDFTVAGTSTNTQNTKFTLPLPTNASMMADNASLTACILRDRFVQQCNLEYHSKRASRKFWRSACTSNFTDIYKLDEALRYLNEGANADFKESCEQATAVCGPNHQGKDEFDRLKCNSSDYWNVLVVDHGSPNKEVTEVREKVVKELQRLLKEFQNVSGVIGSSMERRDGSEYDFNEPLLERAISPAFFPRQTELDHEQKSRCKSVSESGKAKNNPAACNKEVQVDKDREHKAPRALYMVLLLFFTLGSHAGPGGDIDQIVEQCKMTEDVYRELKNGEVGEKRQIVRSDVIGFHPLLVEILYKQLALGQAILEI